MAISVGDAVLKLGVDTKDLDKGMSSLVGRIKKHQKTIGIAMTAVGGSIVAIGIKSLMVASDVEEMTSKFNTVFRENADEVRAWADEMSTAMGRSRFDFMEMAASVQDTFVPMGFAREEAAELSKNLTVLAVDVASFNNKLDADVMRDFQSALVGNTETVRKYGIVITAVGVEQEILNQGWVENKSDITEAMKVQARFNLIMAGTTDAQGDAIRTSGSFANQMKALNANVRDVAAGIGQQLLPIITPLVAQIGEVAKRVTSWIKENPKLTKVIVITVGAVGALLLVLGPLLLILPGLITLLPLLGLAFHAALGPIGLLTFGITMLIAGIALLAANWGRVVISMRRTVNDVKNFFKSAFESIVDYIMAPVRAVLALVQALMDLWNMLMRFMGLGGGGRPSESEEERRDRAAGIAAGEIERETRSGGGASRRAGIAAGEIERETRVGAFQAGGIITRPTLAMLGEAGPEAVIPLRGGKPIVQVINHVYLDGEEVGQRVIDRINDEIALKGGF